MRLDEEYIRTGFFWLPGQEDKKIPGVLSINDGGKVELEIVGHFTDEVEVLTGSDHIERIVGFVENDSFVTLTECIYSSKSISFGGISKSKIHVRHAFFNKTRTINEPIEFDSFSFEVDCLDEWVNITGINVERDWEKRTANITYSPPEKISFPLKNGMIFEINFTYTLPGYQVLKEAKINQKINFNINSETPRPLEEYTSIAFKITNLMSFAIDDVVSIKNICTTSPQVQRLIGDRNHKDTIKIFYESISFSNKIPNHRHYEMLFTYNTIKNDIQNIFNNWISAYDSFSSAFDLYFSTKNGGYKYLESKFLALAQGLETYHRRISDEKLMDQNTFDNLVSSLLKSCPEENKTWLEGRLTYGNEINLRTRIKKIIEPFKMLIGTSKERSRLLAKIVDTRNYLTHYSESLKDNSAKKRELWIICIKMEVIFTLHFLSLIGISDEEILKISKNCQSLKMKIQEKLEG